MKARFGGASRSRRPCGDDGRAAATCRAREAPGVEIHTDSAEVLTRSIARDRYVKTLHQADAQRAAKAVGPLGWDEMYGYEPALALGGSGDPETVRRLNIFNHDLLLSQLGELKLRKF